MSTTFLVTLSTSDTDFLLLAQEISDTLDKAGMDVVTVHPWKRKDNVASPTPPIIQLPKPL